MANLTEVSQWENVIRQIENGEAATGGADGLANVQAKQLANRTQYLKKNYLPLTGGALTGNALTWNGNDLAGSAIVAKSLGANGYVKYASGLIIQWGVALCDVGSKVTKVTLPLSFPANEYRTIICPMCTNAETTVKPVAAFDTNRTFDTFDIISADRTYIEYIAIGR